MTGLIWRLYGADNLNYGMHATSVQGTVDHAKI